MSRISIQSTEMGLAILRAGSRARPVVVGRAARHFSVNAPGFHQQPVDHYWRHHQARYRGLAVAVAGSVSLLVLSQLKNVEELLPSFIKQGKAQKRIEEFYALQGEQTLGRGQFGTVSTATDKATGEIVAVKCVPRSKATEAHFREETEVHREVGAHPNVVGLKGVFADDECWYMVMELAQGGELFDRLTTEGVVLQDEEVRSLLRETADAIAYMHDRGIVHGDVKPENMLLTAPVTVGSGEAADTVGMGVGQVAPEKAGVRDQLEGTGEKEGLGKVLLADFGSSFRLRGGAGGGSRAVKEYTVAYSAPEVVKNNPAVDQKADVWSLGVIAYVMVKGHHPFDPTSEADDDEIMESIINSQPDWDGVEPQAAQLIRQMLSRNPADRPSAREVLQNPWLQSAVSS